MAQAAFLCEGEGDVAPRLPTDVLAPTASLFGEGERLAVLAGDARRAGLAVRAARPLESLLRGDGGVLGDIVLVDCPAVDGAGLAALVRLDQRAARAGAQLVVATSVGALEDVFGCLEGRDVSILVDPTPAQAPLADDALDQPRIGQRRTRTAQEVAFRRAHWPAVFVPRRGQPR